MKKYNFEPYYDDFDSSKNYHQVLFKPGRFAVQARELNQLQTILRDQIEKFGNHIFRHGSVVIPGNSIGDLSVPFVKINTTYNAVSYNASQFEGQTIIGNTSGIEAFVRKAVSNGDNIVLYLNYVKGGGETGNNVFSNSEEIAIKDSPTLVSTALSSNATGIGSIAFINRGVYYVNGVFVEVSDQSVVMSAESSTPSCHVLLRIDESIVTSDDDPTLLSNAQGQYNFAAPGADRVKITLTLETLPLGSVITNNYIEIMRYNNGVLEEHAKNAKYSELEKTLARRMYDTSGNFLVEGFGIKLREHLRTAYNDGYLVNGDRNKFVVEVSPGKGYIDGFESESIYTRKIVLDKARTPEHTKTKEYNVETKYGRYLYVTDLKDLPNFVIRQKVDLYNDNDRENASAIKVGEARVVTIDYHAGDPDTDTSIYKLYIHSLSLNPGYSLEDVGGIRFNSAGAATVLLKYNVTNANFDFVSGEVVTSNTSTNTATVERFVRSSGELYVYKHDHTKLAPKSGESISSGTKTGTINFVETVGGNTAPPIFEIPVYPIKALKNTTNNYDIEYTSWEHATITTNSSGNGSYTVSGATIVPIEAGTVTAVSLSGIVPRNKLSIVGGTQLVITGGPVSTTVDVTFQIRKVAVQPKIKTLTQLTLTGVTPASTISLGKADIVRVIQITNSSGIDVTANYSLDNGQTDYAYFNGSLNLIGALPSGTLTIIFEYFEHSGSGDYFSVDSYASLGDDYIVRIPSYRSVNSSKSYNLGSCLDFRPRVGTSNDFSSGGAQTIDIPVSDTFTKTSVQYYVGRMDTIVLGKNGRIEVKRGEPAEFPVPQASQEGYIRTHFLYILPYTETVLSVVDYNIGNYRYTVDGIKELERKLNNVEYLSLLNSIKETGYPTISEYNRNRTGYIVEGFTNLVDICDFFSKENVSTMYYDKLVPYTGEIESIFGVKNSSNYQITAGQISLPYTEVKLIDQTTSTRISNLNPFMVFSWEGSMTIEPSFDTWVEIEDLETIFLQESVTVEITQTVSVPCPPPVYYGSDYDYSPPSPPPSLGNYTQTFPDVAKAYDDYGHRDYATREEFNQAHFAQYGKEEGRGSMFNGSFK